SIARKTQSPRGVDRKKTLTLNRQIKSIPGVLDRTLCEAQPVTSEHSISIDGKTDLRRLCSRVHEIRAKVLAHCPVPRRLGICQIRRRRIQCLCACNQTRYRSVVSAIHHASSERENEQEKSQRGLEKIGRS